MGLNNTKVIRAALWLLLALPAFAAAEAEPVTHQVSGGAWVYQTTGDYHDVRANLVEAIQARGIVISYTAHAASMLQRTAEAVGAMRQAYDNADILLFCKADLTYELTIENPHNLALCPYSISVYTLAKDFNTVYLGIRSPELQVPEYRPIHELLVEIIEETLEW